MKVDEILSSSGETAAYARMYIEQQLDYIKLETAKKIAISTSSLITVSVIAIMGLVASIFLSIALGFFLGSILASNALAFLIIGMLYIFLTVLIVLFKHSLITSPVLTAILQKILED